MLKSRSFRTLALAALLAIALTLVPVAPAVAAPMDAGFSLRLPSLWQFFVQVWAKSGVDVDPDGHAGRTTASEPPEAPLQIGSTADPEG